MATFKILPETA